MFDPETLKSALVRAGIFAAMCFLLAVALLVFAVWLVGGP